MCVARISRRAALSVFSIYEQRVWDTLRNSHKLRALPDMLPDNFRPLLSRGLPQRPPHTEARKLHRIGSQCLSGLRVQEQFAGSNLSGRMEGTGG